MIITCYFDAIVLGIEFRRMKNGFVPTDISIELIPLLDMIDIVRNIASTLIVCRHRIYQQIR